MKPQKTSDHFILVRHGVINLKGGHASTVQCSGVNHQFYKYGVGVMYAEGLKLDSNGWLIDNNAIDAVVQKIRADSCEQMLVHMKSAVLKKLMKAKIPFVGIKILLQPFIVADEKVAEFTICSILDDSFRLEVMTMKVEVC